MRNATRALAIIDHFQAIADSEPSRFRDHGGIHKGWTRTRAAETALNYARRADRLYGRLIGKAQPIGPIGILP